MPRLFEVIFRLAGMFRGSLVLVFSVTGSQMLQRNDERLGLKKGIDKGGSQPTGLTSMSDSLDCLPSPDASTPSKPRPLSKSVLIHFPCGYGKVAATYPESPMNRRSTTSTFSCLDHAYNVFDVFVFHSLISSPCWISDYRPLNEYRLKHVRPCESMLIGTRIEQDACHWL